jgi:hypothetical protein
MLVIFVFIPFFLVPYSNWKERLIFGILVDLFLAGLFCAVFLTNLK